MDYRMRRSNALFGRHRVVLVFAPFARNQWKEKSRCLNIRVDAYLYPIVRRYCHRHGISHSSLVVSVVVEFECSDTSCCFRFHVNLDPSPEKRTYRHVGMKIRPDDEKTTYRDLATRRRKYEGTFSGQGRPIIW